MSKTECILNLLNEEFLSIKEISGRLNYTIPITRVCVKRLLDRNQVIIYKKRDHKIGPLIIYMLERNSFMKRSI